jgi:hypothetical protein
MAIIVVAVAVASAAIAEGGVLLYRHTDVLSRLSAGGFEAAAAKGTGQSAKGTPPRNGSALPLRRDRESDIPYGMR